MQLMLLTLLDGTTVLDPADRPEDKPLLVAGLRALSPETAMRRFLSPKVSLQRGRAALPDRGRPATTTSRCRRRGRPGCVAVARCVRTAPDTADLAIVVGDPWQGLGLGRRLLRLLADAAAAEGVTRFAGTMLADNRPALRLMKGFGDALPRRRSPTACAKSSPVWPPDRDSALKRRRRRPMQHG